MANITINGAKYNDVPRVDVPSQSGGVSSFYETNGTLSITENGTYDVKSKENVAVNVASSGGGLTLDDYMQQTQYDDFDDIFGKNPNIVTNCTCIRNYQFYRTRVKNITANKLTNVSDNLCNSAAYLERFTAMEATQVRSYAFSQAKNLTKVVLPKVTYIMQSAFYSCDALEEAQFESLESIGYEAFQRCSIKNIDMSKVKTVATSAFSRSNIMKAKMPLVESMDSGVFQYCINLTMLDISNPEATKVPDIKGYNAFSSCTSMKALILRSTSQMIKLTASGDNKLPPTVTDGTCFIYVPRTLLETYKTATNWSVYAEQFRALEDYTVDGTLSGDIDETKI